VRLGDGRVLPAADQAPRNGRGRGDRAFRKGGSWRACAR
jgi:hypothetical protein